MKPLNPSHREKKRYLLIKGKDADKKVIEDFIINVSSQRRTKDLNISSI